MRWWLDWNRVLNRWGGRQFRVSRVKSFTLWPQMRTLADCWSCNFGTFGTSLFFPRPRIHHFSPWSNFVLVASAADVVATAFVLFDSLLSVRLDGARDSHQIRTWKCFNERHEKNEIKKGQRVWRAFSFSFLRTTLADGIQHAMAAKDRLYYGRFTCVCVYCVVSTIAAWLVARRAPHLNQ